ncbi:MAG: NYN domain-containing protein [Candidatus Melainabacteria bacterium]|nr:NYN domain-containing protein [Candidatus Melainabacteria bacterium]MBI3309054.1 NYN domain-containing protein [Candidatus Melainabacteria bacterium]
MESGFSNVGDHARGRIAIFIDGNNLFHAARTIGLEVDYAKLLKTLCNKGSLLRAFFYTGVDENAAKQQGFLLWMRRNGYRVVQKELKVFPDGTKKANLDVEIAVDMLSLCGKYETAILVSGDEDFAYAVNAVAYKGARVEVAGFRNNTSPKLIDVADRFIDLDSMIPHIIKEPDSEEQKAAIAAARENGLLLMDDDAILARERSSPFLTKKGPLQQEESSKTSRDTHITNSRTKK